MSDGVAVADEQFPLANIKSVKHRRFILAYVGEARFNASEAARIAGYTDPAQAGWVLKKREDVRACIDALLAEHALSSTEVLAELRDVAMRGLDESIEVRHFGEEVSARMDARAKMKALELLTKAHGLLTENVNVGGQVTVSVVGVDSARVLGLTAGPGGDR